MVGRTGGDGVGQEVAGDDNGGTAGAEAGDESGGAGGVQKFRGGERGRGTVAQ
jgi:hypothetical protein